MNFGNKHVKAILVALLIAAMGTTCAFAASPLQIEQTSDYDIKVGGLSGVGEYLTIDVYVSGTNSANLTGGGMNGKVNESDDAQRLLYYHDQLTAEEIDNGEFVFRMNAPKTGDYDLYYKYDGKSGKETFYYVSKVEYDKLIEQIRGHVEKKEETKLIELVEANLKQLTFDKLVNEKTRTSVAAKYLYGHLCNYPLKQNDDTNREKLVGYWKRCVAVDGFFTGELTDIIDSKAELGIESLVSAKFFAKDFVAKAESGAKLKAALNTYVEGKNAASIEQFEKDVDAGFVLAVAEYPDGAENLLSVLKEYFEQYPSEDTSVSSYLTLDNSRKIANKSYESIAKLVEALKKPASTPPGGDGGSGGGGGGGGSSAYNGNVIGGETDYVPSTPQNPAAFGDIAGVPWAQEAIESLFAQRIISGKAEGVFAPNDYITREEVVKMLVEAFYKDYAMQSGCDYQDIDKNAWYYNYVARGVEKGIVNGYNDKVFGIGDNITREDFCVMVYRILDVKYDNNLSFDDNSNISDYAVEAVNALSNMGIVNGVGNNRFAPKNNATRAEAAKIIYMALNSVKEVAE